MRRVLPARVASLCATTRLGRDRKDVVTSAFSIGLTTADNKELADREWIALRHLLVSRRARVRRRR